MSNGCIKAALPRTLISKILVRTILEGSTIATWTELNRKNRKPKDYEDLCDLTHHYIWQTYVDEHGPSMAVSEQEERNGEI